MPPDRPNVLLLLSDQHSFRYLGHRDPEDGGVPVRTPTLDDLAASGVSFDRAYCQMPLCTPSRLSLLTGRRARAAGAWSNRSVLRPGLETLPATLSTAGYATCLQGKMHLGGNRQFAGFDRRPYGDLTGGTGHQFEPPGTDLYGIDWRSLVTDVGVTGIPESLRQERNVAGETVSFLREHRHVRPDEPWFVCASFSRPHWPRTAPRRHVERYPPGEVAPPTVGLEGDSAAHPMAAAVRERLDLEGLTDEETARARAAYAACVDYLDEVLGDLLATLDRDGFLDDTVVVYTSDHGENAGEHGLWDKQVWTEAATRVPLLVQLPDHRDGGRDPATVSTPVGLVDLFPTLCGLADVEPPADLDGTDLSGAVRTGAEPDRDPVVVDHLDGSLDDRFAYRAVVDGRYKYVGFDDAPELLFDLEADPDERRNLAAVAENDADVADALARFRGIVDETMGFAAARLEREDDEALRETYALGSPQGTGNAYAFPDGRVVDADTPLYHPHVLATDPSVIIDDYPGGG